MSNPKYYIPAIDGLRAIAVSAVVLYHLRAWIPAGFVGVDIFFVVSGFVVSVAATSLPVVSFRQFVVAFYARRVLRIVPALLLCLLVTGIVSTLIIPDGWLSNTNTNTGVAAFFGASNLILASTANDYWSPRTEFNPFTHTWSLGVEEQFYVVFPFLFYAYVKGHRKALWAILAVLGIGSLAVAAAWANPARSVAAFYLLPSRFWELACGVGLFLGMKSWRPLLAALPPMAGEAFAIAGVVGLVLSFVMVDSSSFPWPWALLPVVSSVVLIASVTATPNTRVASALSSGPAVMLGKISYSLYLWHWPVIVFARWTTGMDSLVVAVSVAAIALACATFSYVCVETPLRHATWLKSVPRARIVLVAVIGLVVAASANFGSAYARPWLSLSVTRDSQIWSSNAELSEPGLPCELAKAKASFHGGMRLTFEPTACSKAPRTVFVAGDSHASAYMPMLKLYARKYREQVLLFTQSGCGFFDLRAPVETNPAPCRDFIGAVLDEVQRAGKSGDVLFLPGLRVPRFADQWGGLGKVGSEDRATVAQEAIGRLSAVSDRGIRVVFEAPTPVFKAPPFRCADWFNARNPICAAGTTVPREDMEERRRAAMASMQQVVRQLPGGVVWDPLPVLCPADPCSAFRGDKPLFFDGDHLSGFGNSLLEDSFAEMIGSLSR